MAQVRSEIRNTDLDSAVIEEAINQASRAIDGITGRDFFVHVFEPDNELVVRAIDSLIFGDQLHLPYYPVLTLTSVVAAGEEWEEGVDYIIENGRVLHTIDGGDWPEGILDEDAVVIVGDFGYPQDAETDVPSGIPEDITRACIQIAANFTGFNQKDVIDGTGLRQTITDKTIPKEALKLARKWAVNGGDTFKV